MSRQKSWSVWFLAASAAIQAHGQTCTCASTTWYPATALPALVVQTVCPEWPAVIPSAAGAGTLLPLPEVTGLVYLSDRQVAANRGREARFRSVADGESQECTSYYTEGPLYAAGWNVLLLNRWYTAGARGRAVRLQDGILADMAAPTLLPVAEEAAPLLEQLFARRGRGQGPALSGFSVRRFPAYYNPLLRRAALNSREAGAVSVTTLLRDIQSTLQRNGWTDFTVGMAEAGGALYPAILKRWGERQRVFASYGRFTQADQARSLGHTLEDQLYFSRPSLYPAQSTETMSMGLRYGAEIRTSRQDVIANRERFDWFTTCRCSDMPYQPDEHLNPIPDAAGNWTPISPSNFENRNFLQLKECPDHMQYASLYERCVNALLADDDFRNNPSERTDYADYLAAKVAEDPVWKSMDPEGTIETEGLGIDNMPETPAYYAHDGSRLNPSVTDVNDPYDPTTRFMVRGDAPNEWGFLDRSVQVNVTDVVRPVYTQLADLFTTFFSKGKPGILDFFGIQDTYFDNPATANNPTLERAAGDMTVRLTIDQRSYFRQEWRLLNTWDKFVPFREPRIFATRSLSAKPVPIFEYSHEVEIPDNGRGGRGSTIQRVHDGWFAVFDYAVFHINTYGDARRIGTLRLERKVYDNRTGRDWESDVRMEGENTSPASDRYDLASREAHTDLKELNARDPESFDKSDAMAKIAFYIAVSEGLDMGMKWLYQQRDKPYVYEAAKRFDNMASTKMSRKLAITMYRSYVEWRRMMDILRDIRDTRRSLERSFTRFKQAGRLLFDYYTNLDYSRLRPTNITMLYPTRAIRYFDFGVDNLAFDVRHFELAAHALALDIDRFLNGPGKATLAYMNGEFLANLSTVDGENEHQRQLNHGALQGALRTAQGSGENNSNYIRLSALTKLALQKTQNLQIKSLEASTSGLRNVLTAVQSDSRDWLTMGDYITENIAGTPDALLQSFEQRRPRPVAQQLKVGTLFSNSWVDQEVQGLAP